MCVCVDPTLISLCMSLPLLFCCCSTVGAEAGAGAVIISTRIYRVLRSLTQAINIQMAEIGLKFFFVSLARSLALSLDAVAFYARYG